MTRGRVKESPRFKQIWVGPDNAEVDADENRLKCFSLLHSQENAPSATKRKEHLSFRPHDCFWVLKDKNFVPNGTSQPPFCQPFFIIPAKTTSETSFRHARHTYGRTSVWEMKNNSILQTYFEESVVDTVFLLHQWGHIGKSRRHKLKSAS